MLSLAILAQKEPVAHVAQLVEHVLGKDEVSGSIPLMGSSSSFWAGTICGRHYGKWQA